MTPLAEQIAIQVDRCISNTNYEGVIVWRDIINNEEWKILVTYDGYRENVKVSAKRRDPEFIQIRGTR